MQFYTLFLTVIIFVLYFTKPSWVLLFRIIVDPIIVPILVFFLGVNNYDDTIQYFWNIWAIFNRAFLVIIAYELFIKRTNFPRKLSRIFVPFFLLVLFFIVHYFFTQFESNSFFSFLYSNAVGALYTLTPMVVLLLNEKTWPNIKQMYVIIFCILVIQLIWLPLNYEGIFAFVGRYEEMYRNADEASLMTGTFLRSNQLANYVALSYMFVTLDFFYRHKFSFWLFFCFSIICGVLLICSGSKLPAIVTVINLLLCTFVFKKYKFVLLSCSFILLCLSVNNLSFPNFNEIGGADRISGGLQKIINSKGSKGGTTFDLSLELLDRYFFESPLIGNGNSHKGLDKAYRISNSSYDLTLFKADATLAYYLVEYGLLGVLLFLLFFYQILVYISSFLGKDCLKIVLILFFFYIMYSITEGGIFDKELFVYNYFYLFGLHRYYKYYNLHFSINH